VAEMHLRRLGYWLGPHAPGWPDVHQYVDADWDQDVRAEVWSYVRAGFPARAYLGP